jgi:hypothetical protein
MARPPAYRGRRSTLRHRPPRGARVDEDLAPFLRLGAAVLRQAFKDLRGPNGVALEAAAWLYSADGLLFLDALNLNPCRLPQAIDEVLDGASLRLPGAATADK